MIGITIQLNFCQPYIMGTACYMNFKESILSPQWHVNIKSLLEFIYPTSEHFLGHAIAVFGRGIEVVPRDVMVFQGMFLEEMDEKDKEIEKEE